MVLHLDTWYENQDGHGNSVACLKLEFKHADSSMRDLMKQAILDVFHTTQPQQGVLGFHKEE
jgi:hypothetical protein